MPGWSRAVAVLLVSSGVAHADGMVVVGGSPRSIGRAGAGLIGDDGAGALLTDPAALAGREATRVQLGASYLDDQLSWQPTGSDAPQARGQAGSTAMPTIAGAIATHGWMFGVAAMTAAVSDRALAQPVVPPTAFGAQFQYRYAGLGGSVRRDSVTFGAARRLGDEIAIGLALGGSRVRVAETRAIWAGFSGIHPVGDPRDDVTLAMTGTDDFVPSAVGSMIFAPEDTALELAISVGWAGAAHLDGGVTSSAPSGGPTATNGTAHLQLAQPWSIRTGARYAAERWIAELDGDLWVFPSLSRDESWTITGVDVAAHGATASVPAVTSRLAPQTHGAIRGAIDVALIPGFLWATAGYAYTTPGTPEARLSPTFADLGGHTAALGLEANAGGYTVTLGASRTWTPTLHPGASQFALDNPFGAGDAEIPVGAYAGTVDQVGVMVDAEL